MKRIYTIPIIICVLLWSPKGFAQSDEERVSIYAIVPDNEGIPSEACHNLETKLQHILTDNGIADKGYAERFVLTAKVDIVSKDIVPSTPARISQKVEVTFMVGDVVENKLYETCSIVVTGVGTNETKAYISAFSNLNPRQEELRDMLTRAKVEIVDYYTYHCDEIVSHAVALGGLDKYDEAIFQLLSVPNVCANCFQQCQTVVQQIYIDKINHEGAMLLNQAKAAWAAQPNSNGASEAASYISQINPQSAAYADVETLLKTMETKLKQDENREWTLQMKKIESEQAFQNNIVDACKSVGMAWAKRRPRTWLGSIISRWF